MRQLNKYDFHKIRASESGDKYGDNAWVFRHPDFQQHKVELLDNIRRKTTVSSRKQNAAVTNATTNNNAEALDNVPNTECGDNGPCGNGSTCSTTGGKEACDPAAICGPVIAAEMASRHAITQALETRINELEANARRSRDELRTISGLNSVLLQRLHSAQNAIQTTTSVLRKLIILSSGGREASDNPAGFNNPAYLDLLQSLNTIESTRNDTPMVNLPSRRTSAIPTQRPNVSLSPVDSQYGIMLPAGSSFSTGVSPAYTENGVVLRAHGPRHAAGNGGNRPLVLLVDDNNVSARKIGKFVREFGCDIEVTNDGVDAWHRAQAREESLHSATSGGTVPPRAFSLVLMDSVIPSLDGKTAATQMRKSGVGAAIIVMTSAATEDVQDDNKDGSSRESSNIDQNSSEKDCEARLLSRKRSLEGYMQAGISEILVKPFKKEDLFRVLRRYLGDLNGLSSGRINSNTHSASSSSGPGGLGDVFGLENMGLGGIGLEDIGLEENTLGPDPSLNNGSGGLNENESNGSSSSSVSTSSGAGCRARAGEEEKEGEEGEEGEEEGEEEEEEEGEDRPSLQEPKRVRMY